MRLKRPLSRPGSHRHALSYDVSEIFFSDNMSSQASGLYEPALSERIETPRCPTENPGHDGLERCRGGVQHVAIRPATRHTRPPSASLGGSSATIRLYTVGS